MSDDAIAVPCAYRLDRVRKMWRAEGKFAKRWSDEFDLAWQYSAKSKSLA
jgi:hypothetical protein